MAPTSLPTVTPVCDATVLALAAAIHRLALAIDGTHAQQDVGATSNDAAILATEAVTAPTVPPALIAVSNGPLTANNNGPTPEAITEALDTHSGPSEGPWYTVTRGSNVGVFHQQGEATHLTLGASGASFKRHNSKTEAVNAYIHAWSLGGIRII